MTLPERRRIKARFERAFFLRAEISVRTLMVPVRKLMTCLVLRAPIFALYISNLWATRRNPNHLRARSYDPLAKNFDDRDKAWSECEPRW